jgi:AraC family transcriptional regulator
MRLFDGFQNAYLFKELLHCANLPNAHEGLVNAVLLHILNELYMLAQSHGQSFDERAEKVYEWIRANASANLSVSRIAKHFGYSPDHVSRILKKRFSAGAKELTSRFLLARAKSLLSNTDKYVKEISAELGFATDKAFICYFKYHEGCFPVDYRKKYVKLHINSK